MKIEFQADRGLYRVETKVVLTRYFETWECRQLLPLLYAVADIFGVTPKLRQAALDAKNIFGEPAEIGAAAKEHLQFREKLFDENFSLAKATDTQLFDAPGLFPYQRAGVYYILRNKAVYLADQMGLGKSLQALTACIAANALPLLIICPKTLIGNWVGEIDKWYPGKYRIKTITEKLIGPDNTDILVANYDMVWRHIEVVSLLQWRGVIVDEAHNIKDPRTHRSQAVVKLLQAAEYRILLSGTPVVNGRPAELLAPLTALGVLHHFGGKQHFLRHYCNAHRGPFGFDINGSANEQELAVRLRAVCMVRREKDQVNLQLPALLHQKVPVTITNRTTYDHAEDQLIEYFQEKIFRELSAAGVASAEIEEEIRRKVLAAESAPGLVKIAELRQLAAHGKIQFLKEFLDEFIETNTPLVVFIHHRKLQESFMELYPPAPHIWAGEDAQLPLQRHQAGEFPILGLSLQACKEGLNIPWCSHVAFLELPWTPSAVAQAYSRCHRIGSVATCVNVYYLLGIDTIDETIYNVIDQKDAKNAAIQNPGAIILAAFLAARSKRKNVTPKALAPMV